MTPVAYAVAFAAIVACVWLAVRFFSETRCVLRYIDRVKKSGHIKSEIRRLRREAKQGKRRR